MTLLWILLVVCAVGLYHAHLQCLDAEERQREHLRRMDERSEERSRKIRAALAEIRAAKVEARAAHASAVANYSKFADKFSRFADNLDAFR